MGDLLTALREFVCMDCTKEALGNLLDWPVVDLAVNNPQEDETWMHIALEKGLVLEARYFLSEGLRQMHDDCEIRLKLRTDLTSRVAYNVYYSRYIHGQGYIRVSLADVDNRMLEKILEEFYLPRLKEIYKPKIQRFRGFFTRDFFGVEAGREGGYIYYSPVRGQREEINAEILAVVSKLYDLDSLLKGEDLRHKLAELDLQMSFLPSVMWM